MDQEIEFHDSQLGDTQLREGALTIRLAPAYVHRFEERPGTDRRHTGWWQDAELHFANVVARAGIDAAGELNVDSRWIVDASIQTPDHRWQNVIPVPIDVAGPLQFAAQTNENDDLLLEADHMSIRLTGEAEFEMELDF